MPRPIRSTKRCRSVPTPAVWLSIPISSNSAAYHVRASRSGFAVSGFAISSAPGSPAFTLQYKRAYTTDIPFTYPRGATPRSFHRNDASGDSSAMWTIWSNGAIRLISGLRFPKTVEHGAYSRPEAWIRQYARMKASAPPDDMNPADFFRCRSRRHIHARVLLQPGRHGTNAR